MDFTYEGRKRHRLIPIKINIRKINTYIHQSQVTCLIMAWDLHDKTCIYEELFTMMSFQYNNGQQYRQAIASQYSPHPNPPDAFPMDKGSTSIALITSYT